MMEISSAHGTEGPAGSPSLGEPVFLVVGKLRRPHGLHGEMAMEVITDFPERIHPGKTVYIGDEHHPVKVRSRRWHGRLLLIAFHQDHKHENAHDFRNHLVYVRSDELPALPDGEYYHHQLLGLRVVSDDGSLIGHFSKILETGANDVYVVLSESGQEILLPGIDSVIQKIDLERGEIRVQILPGLLPEKKKRA